MVLQHVMALVNAGFTKDEILKMESEKNEPEKKEPEKNEPEKKEPEKKESFDYDKFAQSMLSAFQNANINANHQKESNSSENDLSNFF